VRGALGCTVVRNATNDLMQWTADTDVSWARWSTCQ
jgi:hypothetical protein